MGMTITEKILAEHAGKSNVGPGEFIEARCDVVMANELSGILAIEELEKAGIKRVRDPSKIVLVPDHFTPNKDLATAEITKRFREWAKSQGVENYFELGRVGIEHVILPEKGLVLPGDVVVGGDSHTCTYGAVGCFSTGMGSTDIAAAFALGTTWLRVPETIKVTLSGNLREWVTGKDIILALIADIGVEGARYQAMEYHGDAILRLSMSERLTIANMTIEAGGKNGIFPPDEVTVEYVKNRNPKRPWKIYQSDPDANFAKFLTYNLSDLEPQVAFPHTPENSRPLSKVPRNITVDQVFIGSCTNGKLEDLRLAAKIFRGRKINSNLRTIVTPASQEVYLAALKEGLIQTFIEAECAVTTPSCGACLGGHMGVLASGERCLSTTNRNFVGRMGSPTAEVYLANPAIAAATAVLGRIGGPEEL
jgi:3-isopropylmalate/(R)-2-methylmalate dehydratase large subunit